MSTCYYCNGSGIDQSPVGYLLRDPCPYCNGSGYEDDYYYNNDDDDEEDDELGNNEDETEEDSDEDYNEDESDEIDSPMDNQADKINGDGKMTMSPATKSTQSPKLRGIVKYVPSGKYYGFISREDNKGEVFVHFTDVKEQNQQLSKGEIVEFEVENGPKGLRAINVQRVITNSVTPATSKHSPVFPFLKKLFDSVTKPQEKPHYDEKVEKEVLAISKILKANSHKLPEQRNPTILICGKAGAGKSTTINTLFMKKVSKIGHTSRGTDKEKVFDWVVKGENINIVDLPGLGDTPEHDKDFEQRYRKHAKNADGFIVVVTPPRPAEIGTIKTVNLLLGCGVPSSKIIFGYNKLSQLKYDSKDGKTVRQVEVDSILGLTPEHKIIVEEAMNDFFVHIRKAIPRANFTQSQIIEFDSLSGWNLHKMLRRVVEIMPNDSLASLGKITRDAHNRKRERDLENLSKELSQFEKKEKALKELEYQLDEKSKDVLKKKEEYQTKRARVKKAEEKLAESEKLLQNQKDEERRILDQREKELFKREQELDKKILDTQLQQLKNDLNKTKEEIEKKIEGMKKEDTLKDKIEQTLIEKVVEVAKEVAGAVVDYGKKALGYVARKLLGLP